MHLSRYSSLASLTRWLAMPHVLGTRVAPVSIVYCLLLSGCTTLLSVQIASEITKPLRPVFDDISALPQIDLERVLHVELDALDSGSDLMMLGEAKGFSCKILGEWKPTLSDINGTTPEEAALKLLKWQVVKAGGNVVLGTSCVHNKWIDLANNCWESWVCTGKAALARSH